MRYRLGLATSHNFLLQAPSTNAQWHASTRSSARLARIGQATCYAQRRLLCFHYPLSRSPVIPNSHANRAGESITHMLRRKHRITSSGPQLSTGISGINSLIHSVSLASHVSTHLLIHLLARLRHPHSHHPSRLHFFTPGSKPTFSTNPSHLILILPWTAFATTGPYRTYHAFRFIFSSFFYIFFCFPVWWTKLLHVSFLLHAKYTLSYRIVLMAIVRVSCYLFFVFCVSWLFILVVTACKKHIPEMLWCRPSPRRRTSRRIEAKFYGHDPRIFSKLRQCLINQNLGDVAGL